MEITLNNIPLLGKLPEVLEELHKAAESAPNYDKAKWVEVFQLAAVLEGDLASIRAAVTVIVRQIRKTRASGKKVKVEEYAGLLELLMEGGHVDV